MKKNLAWVFIIGGIGILALFVISANMARRKSNDILKEFMEVEARLDSANHKIDSGNRRLVDSFSNEMDSTNNLLSDSSGTGLKR